MGPRALQASSDKNPGSAVVVNVSQLLPCSDDERQLYAGANRHQADEEEQTHQRRHDSMILLPQQPAIQRDGQDSELTNMFTLLILGSHIRSRCSIATTNKSFCTTSHASH